MFTKIKSNTIHLRHSNLYRLPPVTEVPYGYLWRTWRDGDEIGIPTLLGEVFGPKRASFKNLKRFWEDHPIIVPGGISIIETDNREIVGTATGRIDKCKPHLGYVHRVAVQKNHRRRGLATHLVLKTLKYIADNKGRVAIVGTNEHNLQAISIYLKLGFEPVVESQDS